MTRDSKEYMLLNAVTPVAITSSTDATPIVVTATSHGLSTGDTVFIVGHTTNIAANGIYRVTKVNANSFSLQDRNTLANIAGTGAGAGASGHLCIAPKVALVEDYRNAVMTVGTTGTATLNIRAVGSLGKADGSCPNIGAVASPTNPYTYVQLVNLDTAATVNGATGIAVTGTDILASYEVNVNGLKYFTTIPLTFTQGAITVKLKLFNNL